MRCLQESRVELMYGPVIFCSVAAHAWITGKFVAWWADEET